MKLSTILVGGAALVGLGMYLNKKMNENHDEISMYTEEKETYGDKLHKASMFAVGAVKTGTEKISKSLKNIKTQDMVKKGEEVIGKAKENFGQIKDDISDLKNLAADTHEPAHATDFDVFANEDESVMETRDNPFEE